jgi:hypothetical protein
VVEEGASCGLACHLFAAAPSALVDSDAATAAYAVSAGCPAITGSDYDRIMYMSNQPFSSDDVVRIDADGFSGFWKGAATQPTTVITACQ